MTEPAAVPVDVEALALRLVEQLWLAELGSVATNITTAMTYTQSDAERALVLHDQTDRIPLRGRQAYLRTTCLWLARFFDAVSGGEAAEAERWAARAEAEMGRYLREPEGGVA